MGYRPGELEVIREAWDSVFRGCAAESGYSLDPPGVLPPEEPQLALDRLFFDDLERIGREGYRFLFGDMFTPGQGSGGEQPPDDFVEVPIEIEDACRSRANAAFGDGQTVGDADATLIPAQYEIVTGVRSSPKLLDYAKPWSECMSDRGHPGLQHDDPTRWLTFLEKPEVTQEEVSLATADAVCNQESGYTEARLHLLEDAVDAWIAGNNGVVIELRRTIEEEVAVARSLREQG